jgi:DNA ligase (NAD+)
MNIFYMVCMEETMAETGRMKELIDILNKAASVYYQGKDEIMSNFEYDRMYDELSALEKESGLVLAGSPTQKVGYEVLSELPKQTHPSPMLSLDKTKQVDELSSWLGGKEGLLSWKMDGLTVVLTYENGELLNAVTRGNGVVGEVITNNAKVFKNLPVNIPFKGRMVLRGEAIITYSEFKKINALLSEEEQYKNPRNLCSGSVRQLNNEITAKRNVELYAFTLVEAEGVDFKNSQQNKMEFMKEQGFQTVEYKVVTAKNIYETVEWFSEKVKTNDFPSDGLVLLYDDISYGESLGSTAKFPRNAIAFKWADETAKTKLTEVEWSASRTGLINPVAIFEPVELEGTTVSRASVHNISIVKELKLGIGDTIEVYKANMIIPQIAQNLTKSGSLEIPDKCPVCGEKTSIHKENDVEVLFCENPDCLAKKIKSISLFVSRDAMNIDGMSEATIEKFISKGFLHELADLFKLNRYKDEIISMDGFGEKSYEKLVKAAETAKITTTAKFIYSLGIANIGLSNARMVCKAFSNDLEKIRHASIDELVEIDGVGEIIAESFVKFFANENNNHMVDDLLDIVTLEDEENDNANDMEGMNFVITGSVNHFSNRSEVKELIEGRGGKVTGSVTSKTKYLINNDSTSNSSKNKKAKELGVQIITEDEFIDMFSIKL